MVPSRPKGLTMPKKSIRKASSVNPLAPTGWWSSSCPRRSRSCRRHCTIRVYAIHWSRARWHSFRPEHLKALAVNPQIPAGRLRRSYPSLFTLDATGPELCRIPLVSRSHQAHGCFSFLGGDSGSSRSREVLCSKLSTFLRGNRSCDAWSVLPQSHVPLPLRRCHPLQSLSLRPWWKSHNVVSSASSWQHYFVSGSLNLVRSVLHIADP